MYCASCPVVKMSWHSHKMLIDFLDIDSHRNLLYNNENVAVNDTVNDSIIFLEILNTEVPIEGVK